MVLKVRGRHTGRDIFKPGERCQATGSYRCENCAGRNQEQVVQVEEGDIFPMCLACADWEVVPVVTR